MTGFRILECTRRVSPEWVQRYRSLPVANISDVMWRMAAGGPRLRPVHAGGVLAGPAYTVKSRPGDNLLVHKALHTAQAGDVIVVDAGGDLTNAIIGELMVAIARERGIAGFVIHGAIRDYGTLSKGDFPVYAAGVTHRGPYKHGPGEINVPIALDGMVISPGDLIVGDDDGLLCIPYENVESVYDAARAKHESEEQTLQRIAEGQFDGSWIDAALKDQGYRG